MTGPSLATIKRLFATSGNKCAFPQCTNQLVDPSGKVIGEICHIRATRRGGPRYDPSQSEADRHSFDNLLLMCSIHHTVIDSDELKYDKNVLIEIKQNHEKSTQPVNEPSDDVASQFQTNVNILSPNGAAVISQGQIGGITANCVHVHQLIDPQLTSAFLPAEDAFSSLIEKNFLFEFRGPNSDYTELLSPDFRKLFIHIFNKNIYSGRTNRILFSGREGSGKSFNVLLLSLSLIRDGNKVFYCNDVRTSSLTSNGLRTLAKEDNKLSIFIIDNVQNDLEKVEELVFNISLKGSYTDKPKFIFLTRPLDEDTVIDTFGEKTPCLIMNDKLINFEHLISLLFIKLGIPEFGEGFLQKIKNVHFSDLLVKYRNMAFWNEVLRSLPEDPTSVISEDEIFKRVHAFYRKKEPYILDFRQVLSLFLPYFSHGIAIQYDYACELLGSDANAAIRGLKTAGLIKVIAQDWEADDYSHSSTLVVSPAFHATKSKIISKIYRKYYMDASNPTDAIATYAERYLNNLYYILSPFYDTYELNNLYANPRICAVTREYLTQRHLGKMLDRVIKRLAILHEATVEVLLDQNVLHELAKKVNADKAYIVSKMYLFRALQKVSLKKTFELFCLTLPESVITPFLADRTERGITSLSKFMEIFKNIYYYAPTQEDKTKVRSFVATIIDNCRSEFVRRIETNHDYFTQMHWLLKRLHGLKLGNYFLQGIEPERLLKIIKVKNVNIVELRYVLWDGKYTTYNLPDGSKISYYKFIERYLSYDDIKRIFDNKRSDLYDLVINATNPFIAKALVKYSSDHMFKQKSVSEKPYLKNKCIEFIRTNYVLGQEEKDLIIAAIQ